MEGIESAFEPAAISQFVRPIAVESVLNNSIHSGSGLCGAYMISLMTTPDCAAIRRGEQSKNRLKKIGTRASVLCIKQGQIVDEQPSM